MKKRRGEGAASLWGTADVAIAIAVVVVVAVAVAGWLVRAPSFLDDAAVIVLSTFRPLESGLCLAFVRLETWRLENLVALPALGSKVEN